MKYSSAWELYHLFSWILIGLYMTFNYGLSVISDMGIWIIYHLSRHYLGKATLSLLKKFKHNSNVLYRVLAYVWFSEWKISELPSPKFLFIYHFFIYQLWLIIKLHKMKISNFIEVTRTIFVDQIFTKYFIEFN